MPGSKKTSSGVLGGLAGLLGLSVVAGVLIAATVTPAIAVTSAAATKTIDLFQGLPSYLEISKLILPTTLYTKDKATGNDVELARFWTQNRTPVQFDQIAPVMFDSLLSSEDPRFYQHGGVDLLGTTRALLSNAQGGGETQGGSSISQQYVKNVLIQRCEAAATTDDARQDCYTAATRSDGTLGIQRKLQEMRYAIQLEKVYSKNEILLGYLNIANFGGVTYGIEAAAKRYFGVSAKDLTLAQAATLAGMVQNPNTFRIDQPESESNGAANGYALTKQRQEYVLDRLLKDGKITQAQHDEATAAPIEPHITDVPQGCRTAGGAAYFCQYVKYVIQNDPAFGADLDARLATLMKGGLNIYTTLDWDIQDAAQKAMADNAPSSANLPTPAGQAKGRFGSAAVSVEATTGRILAIAQNTTFSESADAGNDWSLSAQVWAGNSTYGASSGFNAGSTFKLFTLVDWLEKGHSVNETVNGTSTTVRKMTNSCGSDWYGPATINNFNNQSGVVGTPRQFTAASLNSGFLAMAAQLDLCDISKVAKKLGVTQGSGKDIDMTVPTQVIGVDNVSPLAMAGAYATIANNGTYCQPQAIDRVTDSDGNEVAKPTRTCEQVITPDVAATAAYALQGVMSGGGTGSQGNPGDGTQLIGKTGTHEALQTWLIESSTKVTTAVWAGNADGLGDVFKAGLQSIRYPMARAIQRAADRAYPAGNFPPPASNLTKVTYKDVPNVVGLSIDDARSRLTAAGFQVSVGDPVDSDKPAGVVGAQNPSGSGPTGGTVTINPSNGQGGTVPEIAGQTLQDAVGTLRSAGFSNVAPGSCTADPASGKDGKATTTNPAAGAAANKGTTITVNYAREKC